MGRHYDFQSQTWTFRVQKGLKGTSSIVIWRTKTSTKSDGYYTVSDCDLKLELARHDFMSYVCCTSFDCVSSAFGARTCGNGWRCGEWK